MTDKVQKIREEVERLKEWQPIATPSLNKLLSLLDTLQEEPVSNPIDFEQELYKAFGQVKDFTLGMRIAKWFYDMGKNSQEPVSDDLPHIRHRDTLDEFAYQCAYDMSNDWAIENPTWHDVEDACKLGAKWQKEQDQSTIELAEDHAMLAGMEKMKEQMMAKSVEAVVSQVPCSNEIILYNPSSVDKYYLPQEMNKLGLNKGDKVKLVIIKED